jgi:hypothetical protein
VHFNHPGENVKQIRSAERFSASPAASSPLKPLTSLLI